MKVIKKLIRKLNNKRMLYGFLTKEEKAEGEFMDRMKHLNTMVLPIQEAERQDYK